MSGTGETVAYFDATPPGGCLAEGMGARPTTIANCKTRGRNTHAVLADDLRALLGDRLADREVVRRKGGHAREVRDGDHLAAPADREEGAPDRRAGLLAVQRPWDAVLVDEAHAARRRVFGGGPNQLLGLLQTLRTQNLFRCLWLLTATPMQLDPHEVHDLLLLCGLDDHTWGRWSNLAAFQGFFEAH